MLALHADLLTVRGPSNNPSKVYCSYSGWSSCSYYCGELPVEKRNKTLVDARPKESRALCPLHEEECGAITCTGKNSQTSINQPLFTRSFRVWSLGGDRHLLGDLRRGKSSREKNLHSDSSGQILRHLTNL